MKIIEIIEIKNTNDFIRHRDNDKPAYIGSNGDQSWWQHGERIKWNTKKMRSTI